MPSYAIIGASRGIGYAFLQHLSANPSNTIIGTVRNAAPTTEKVKADGLPNVHILQADLTDYAALKTAASETAKLTNGSLDYLVVNGAYISQVTDQNFLDEFDTDYDTLVKDLQLHWDTNVVGVISAINAFLPLLQKSSTKKVIAVSSGMAANDLISQYGVWEGAPYAISKAALNTTIAKYDAMYRKDGILFMSVSPGVVDTGAKMPEGSELPMKFGRYAPHFKGPISPEESVKAMLGVVERASVDNGYGGAFVSHFGNKQWL